MLAADNGAEKSSLTLLIELVLMSFLLLAGDRRIVGMCPHTHPVAAEFVFLNTNGSERRRIGGCTLR